LRKTKSVNEQELDIDDIEDEDEVDELGDEPEGDFDIEAPEEEGEDLKDLKDLGPDAGDDVELPELPDEEEPVADVGDELDLTGHDDADVLKIFKDMSDSDQIVVVKTDDGVEIDDKETGAEYIVKGLAESENNESIEDLDEIEEPIYEIVFDESEEINEDDIFEYDTEQYPLHELQLLNEYIPCPIKGKEQTHCVRSDGSCAPRASTDDCHGWEGTMATGAGLEKTGGKGKFSGGKQPKRGGPGQKVGIGDISGGGRPKRSRRGIGEEDQTNEDGNAVEEASRTLASGKTHGRKGLSKPKAVPNRAIAINEESESIEYDELISEVTNLKSKNGEYKEALKVFRKKLNEVAIFNSNLAYATRLFTEHSTTKKEKLTILKRFDEIESLKESKGLYKSICNELNGKQSLTESVDKKVNKNLTRGSANLNESTAYVDPQVKAIKSLMDRIGRR